MKGLQENESDDLCSWGHSSVWVRVEGPPLPATDFTSRDFARIKRTLKYSLGRITRYHPEKSLVGRALVGIRNGGREGIRTPGSHCEQWGK